MEQKEALQIVLDLASDNALNEIDAENDQLTPEFNRQQEALKIVTEIYMAMSLNV